MARVNISDGSSQRTVELVEAVTVAGRAPENKIVIDDKQASRRHFQIEKTDFGYKVVDLESRNGTRVNDRQINLALLRPGDRITIGKHVLTFEDPAFREPPAEVAARFAPPTAPPAAAPAMAAGLPVATEAPKGAAPPPVSPSQVTEDARTRRRSGHTTIINRLNQHEARKEHQTLTLVAVGAGLFLFLLIILIIIPTGGSSSSPEGSKSSGAKPPVTKSSDDDSQKLPPGVTDAEKRDYEELTAFVDKNKNNLAQMDAIWARCTEHKKKYPGSVIMPRIDALQRIADEGQKSSRRAAITEAERQASADLKKSDYGAALKRMKTLLSQYTTDIEAQERITKFMEDVLDKAKAHWQSRRTEAETAVTGNRKLEAREIYQSLIDGMGGGNVPEFDIYCKTARAAMEAIQ